MSSNKYECVNRCTQTRHGNLITWAITISSVTHKKLCAFLRSVCKYCQTSRDSMGRTALHMAASCGNTKLCQWLVIEKNANVNEKDEESGYTALHRSIYYGNIDTTISLVSLGADLYALDKDYYAPIDFILEGHNYDVTKPCFIGWGINSNFTLGLSNKECNTPRKIPIDLSNLTFEKKNKIFARIYLEKFHTIIIMPSSVYTHGIGIGGRLGHGNELTYVKPTILSDNKIDNEIIRAAIGRDHTLLLSKSGKVYSFGSNKYGVLGRDTNNEPPGTIGDVIIPKILNSICCSTYHSVAWTGHDLFIWGLNSGQMGFSSDGKSKNIIRYPKFHSVLSNIHELIIAVGVSNAATALFVYPETLYVYHNFEKITLRLDKNYFKTFNNWVSQIYIIGGNLIDNTEQGDQKTPEEKELNLYFLYTGRVFSWNAARKFVRCAFRNNPFIRVKRLIVLSDKRLIILTVNDEMYEASPIENSHDSRPTLRHFKNDCKYSIVYYEIERIQKVHNISTFGCDKNGDNFIVLEERPALPLRNPLNDDRIMPNNIGLDQLIDGSDEAKQLCDLILEVQNVNFYCHKFIIFSRLPHLLNYPISNHDNSIDLIKLDEIKNLKRFQEHFRSVYGTDELCNSDIYVKYRHSKSLHSKFDLDYDNFPELRDFTIISSDEERIPVHKCILSAKSEYFKNILQHSWLSTSEVCLPFPAKILLLGIKFIYSMDIQLLKDLDLNTLSNTFIVAHYLIISTLDLACQKVLIDNVNLKTIMDLLKLTDWYQAEHLKQYCLDFICTNLGILLEYPEYGLFEYQELLSTLPESFAKFVPEVSHRKITPMDTYLTCEIINREAEKFLLREKDKLSEIKCSISKMRRRRKTSRNSVSEKIDEEDLDLAILDNSEIYNTIDTPSVIPERLRAIESAKEKLIIEPLIEDFVNLSSDMDFPDLSSSFGSPSTIFRSLNRSQQRESGERWRFRRMSQKEKKRLTSESSIKSDSDIDESPRNPWKIYTPSDNCENLVGSLDLIVLEEKKHKAEISKIKRKLLKHTQMEDLAIENLEKFYNVEEISDEFILIMRDCPVVLAAPIWVEKSQKKLLN